MNEEQLLKQIGQRVKSARKRAGLFQWQLAEKVGIYRSSLSDIERGRVATMVTTLYKIADSLQMDVRELL